MVFLQSCGPKKKVRKSDAEKYIQNFIEISGFFH